MPIGRDAHEIEGVGDDPEKERSEDDASDPADTPDDRPITPEGLDTIGLPSRREVVEEYARITGLDLRGSRWYEAFACFKTAVVVQQLYARWQRGETTDARMAERGAWVGPMSRRAARILEGDSL